jgi:hypothetical protein
MSLDSDLNAVCDYLRSRLEMDVVVGRPNEAVPGLYVWPWRTVPKPENRNLPAQPKSGPGIPGFRVHCLLLITPADTLETISKLELAGRTLQENPVLEGSGGLLRITLDPIEPEHLTALFLAARLPLTLCFAFVLEASAPT